mmetsp:Transcript_18297/g.25790  ORF Transcript_18297/g.25790 Transcript_18297/m.25790 type:complete len:349 (+) Transcript_18297:100-1146(+)
MNKTRHKNISQAAVNGDGPGFYRKMKSRSPTRIFKKWFRKSHNDDSAIMNSPAVSLSRKMEKSNNMMSKSESHVQTKSRYGTTSVKTTPVVVQDDFLALHEDRPWDEVSLVVEEPPPEVMNNKDNVKDPSPQAETEEDPNYNTKWNVNQPPVDSSLSKSKKTRKNKREPKKDSPSDSSMRSKASSIASFQSKASSRSKKFLTGTKKLLLGSGKAAASPHVVENHNIMSSDPLTRESSPTKTVEETFSDQETVDDLDPPLPPPDREQSLAATMTTGTTNTRSIDRSNYDESTYERTVTPFSALTVSTYGEDAVSEDEGDDDTYRAYVAEALACSAANSAIFEDLLCIGD